MLYITLHYSVMHCVALHYSTLQCILLHCITLHTYASIACIAYIPYFPLHHITLRHSLHYITLHYITLHNITLHYITLHYIILHFCLALHNLASRFTMHTLDTICIPCMYFIRQLDCLHLQALHDVMHHGTLLYITLPFLTLQRISIYLHHNTTSYLITNIIVAFICFC